MAKLQNGTFGRNTIHKNSPKRTVAVERKLIVGQWNQIIKEKLLIVFPFLSFHCHPPYTHTHKLSHFTLKDISYASRECGCIVPHSSASGRSFFESTCKLTPYESTSSHLCHMLCLLIPPSAISCFCLFIFKMTEQMLIIYLHAYLKLNDLFCHSKLSLK